MEREFIGVQQAFGAEGCPFGPRVAVTVGNTSEVIIPAGVWLVETDSKEIVRTTYDAGSNWITNMAASTVGIVYSDGFNTEFQGNGGGGGTAHRSQLLALA